MAALSIDEPLAVNAKAQRKFEVVSIVLNSKRLVCAGMQIQHYKNYVDVDNSGQHSNKSFEPAQSS